VITERPGIARRTRAGMKCGRERTSAATITARLTERDVTIMAREIEGRLRLDAPRLRDEMAATIRSIGKATYRARRSERRRRSRN
jgi:hypothetical protein